jgi:hypothetical protein
MYPLVGIGTPPTPLPQASVPPPRWSGGTHSPAAKGVGKSQFRRLEISLALCLLCALEYVYAGQSSLVKLHRKVSVKPQFFVVIILRKTIHLTKACCLGLAETVQIFFVIMLSSIGK